MDADTFQQWDLANKKGERISVRLCTGNILRPRFRDDFDIQLIGEILAAFKKYETRRAVICLPGPVYGGQNNG